MFSDSISFESAVQFRCEGVFCVALQYQLFGADLDIGASLHAAYMGFHLIVGPPLTNR